LMDFSMFVFLGEVSEVERKFSVTLGIRFP
jgi:hypothetical protein